MAKIAGLSVDGDNRGVGRWRGRVYGWLQIVEESRGAPFHPKRKLREVSASECELTVARVYARRTRGESETAQ